MTKKVPANFYGLTLSGDAGVDWTRPSVKSRLKFRQYSGFVKDFLIKEKLSYENRPSSLSKVQHQNYWEF